ncbi:MAG: helix-turn-helix domain-containing protein [Terriglobales bacterium]
MASSDENFTGILCVSPNNNSIQPRLLTLKAAAHYLSVGEWALRRLVWAGDLPSVQLKKGARLLFDIVDLNKWIEAHKSG